MTTLTYVLAGLVLSATLATPAVAHDKKRGVRNAHNAYAAAPSRKHHCAARAPDVGAFATAPWHRPPCEPVGWSY